jgi:hypothetical protein
MPPVGSGSDQLAVGSGGAKVEAPKGPVVDTVIEASAPNARVEISGTDQKGDAPFTAKLEKDKPYKVRISAPGYMTHELDLVGGAPKHNAALVPKPRVLSLKTDPSGATVAVDGTAGGKPTPVDIELTKAQAAKKSIRVRLFKNGYKVIEKTIEADKYTEEDARMIATVDEKLQVQAARPPGPGPGPGPGSGSGATGGSGGGPGPAGGSAPPPPPPPDTPGGGSGAAP